MNWKHVAVIALSMLGGAYVFGNAEWNGKDAMAEENESTIKSERFFMLNALWFKEDGGAEKYNEYLAAAGPFVAKHGGIGHDAYAPEANIIGSFDADLVFFVEWPNEKAFTTFIADEGYQAVSHLREEAIRDSLLIRCRKVE